MSADERKMSIAFDNMEIESEAGLKDWKLNGRWENTFFISRSYFLRSLEFQGSREINGIEARGRCGLKRNIFLWEILEIGWMLIEIIN